MKAYVYHLGITGAENYYIWCSPYPDGRGAINMTPAGTTNGKLIYGLRPAIKFYYWVTWKGAKAQMSKPSPVHQQVLIDQFKEK
tara:strand:- start:7 stop:258 length:252 start_codon:yes stop_codon:yes gene_type:complete